VSVRHALRCHSEYNIRGGPHPVIRFGIRNVESLGFVVTMTVSRQYPSCDLYSPYITFQYINSNNGHLLFTWFDTAKFALIIYLYANTTCWICVFHSVFINYFRDEEVIWRRTSWRNYRGQPILRHWYCLRIHLDGMWKATKNVKSSSRPSPAETHSIGDM
jgi:hypothetical protein